ncbi:MAG: AMP-binding protein [Bacteroidetes bacterium]|jgi:long-chain acyl-CoA synthetase|nr:AMP-binding protein [Bacteroidota bacterium]
MSERIYDIANMAEFYQQAAEKFGTLPAFAIREKALKWNPVSYYDLYEQGINLATGLIELGVEARDHVGIFSDNRFEWILSDYAVQFCGAADVPRGHDVSDEELFYIMEHADIRVTFVENKAIQDRILGFRDRLPLLREIIMLNPKSQPAEGIKTIQEVILLGKELRQQGDRRVEERIDGIQPDDLFTLIYTSGTTGQPKGVMLTHSNMISQIRNLPVHHNCTDRVLSILPVWHIFERLIEMYTISFGGCTYYSSVQTLADDMRAVEPTFMASAPRLWENMYQRILKGVKASHPVRRVLFNIAYFLSRQYKTSQYFITNKYLKIHRQPLWRHLLILPFHIIRRVIVMPWYGFFNAAVLERIRLSAGGSLKMTISGGGALPNEVDRFFNFIGIEVLEGYGMTESTPVISVRSGNNLVVGTVGPPIPETEVRIIDPDTNEVLFPNAKFPHNGKSKRGEICVRGPQVMKGYYRNPELTKLTLRNGWLHTGDLGMITYNDCLKILGRSKATIVLSSGENVEPEPIEMRLQQSQFIDHCMVVGQDKKFLNALIVPVLDEFRQNGVEVQSFKDLANNTEAQKIIRDEIKKMTESNNGFKRYEQIRDFRLLTDPFQVGHELTNLYKIKRHVVEQKYNHVITELTEKTAKNKN